MHKFAFFAFLAACALPLRPASPVPQSEYKQRRAALREKIGDGVLILFGNTESEHGNIRSGFFQEPNFYYVTGWNEPGARLVMTPSAEILLIPRRDPEQEKWTGRKLAPGDADVATVTGFDSVGATESFESSLPKWLEAGNKLYTLAKTPGADALRRAVPLRELYDATMHLSRIRAIKSVPEISLIQRATDAGVQAHRAAWKRIKPGLSEYQVAATMSNAYFETGCERHAYSPIVGSGQNGAILHYSQNTRKMDEGELLLMDVGPECSMYATDITRTVPVSGKFNSRQRELYDIVLGAQKAAIAAVKPGVMLGSRTSKTGLQKLVIDYFNSHGADKHGKPLGQYFTHGLGHHVGLDVHDPYDPAIPLAPGMVITIEPGLYIPEESIGIRIEDVVLVTEDGAKVLSSSLPSEAEAIERAMAR